MQVDIKQGVIHAAVYLIALSIGLFFLIAPAFACPNNVQRIGTGESSPCSGWLVKDSQMQVFTKNSDELVKTKELVEAQDKLLKLSEAEMEFFKRSSRKAREEAFKAEGKAFWTGVGGFALGVVLTGIAAKAAIEAAK
jgi:hypothetical protein